MDVNKANEVLREAVSTSLDSNLLGERFRPEGGKGRLLIKFPSHRQRDNATRSVLTGDRRSLTSLQRETGHGVYEVTPKEIEKLKERGIKFSKFKDGDDLRGAWSVK